MLKQKIIRLSPIPQGFGDIRDELDPLQFASELPVQHTHVYYENESLGLYIGAVSYTNLTLPTISSV